MHEAKLKKPATAEKKALGLRGKRRQMSSIEDTTIQAGSQVTARAEGRESLTGDFTSRVPAKDCSFPPGIKLRLVEMWLKSHCEGLRVLENLADIIKREF